MFGFYGRRTTAEQLASQERPWAGSAGRCVSTTALIDPFAVGALPERVEAACDLVREAEAETLKRPTTERSQRGDLPLLYPLGGSQEAASSGFIPRSQSILGGSA